MIKEVEKVYEEVIAKCEAANESSMRHLILSADNWDNSEVIMDWMKHLANEAYVAGYKAAANKIVKELNKSELL